jgi:HK97 gp10 family phage protein
VAGEAVSFKVEGLRELENMLTQLPDEVAERKLNAAVKPAAELIRDEAIRRAPVEAEYAKLKAIAEHTGYGVTGETRPHLVDNIVARPDRSKNREHSITWKIGWKKKTFWGMFLEFGTSKMAARPWLRPAADTKKVEAVTTIKEALKKNIFNYVRRHKITLK